MVSLDSSGELLHKRGWRTETGSAPLRETLAAAILRLCHYQSQQPFVDPMCGSGTFSIEAASMARNVPPGFQREFAFTAWPCHDHQAWKTLRTQIPNPTTEPFGPILASDRDPQAIKTAQRNAERAGLLPFISIQSAPLEQIAVPPGPGLVVVNPPYGHRLGDRRELSRTFRALGQRLRQAFPSYRAAILCPDRPALEAITAGCRWRPDEILPLRNGGLQIFLAIWSFPPQKSMERVP
jgi:putative N6-adenine-specific DNA methylase